MSCWVHKEASGLWQWPRQALFQELRGQRVFGLWGPLSPNFPQKCQTRTFRKLISNTWVRARFQTDLGTEKRKDLDMHMTSAMGQQGTNCPRLSGTEGLPRIWNFQCTHQEVSRKARTSHSIFQRNSVLLQTTRDSRGLLAYLRVLNTPNLVSFSLHYSDRDRVYVSSSMSLSKSFPSWFQYKERKALLHASNELVELISSKNRTDRKKI